MDQQCVVLTKPICDLKPVCVLCPTSLWPLPNICPREGQSLKEGGSKLRFAHSEPVLVLWNAEQLYCLSQWLFGDIQRWHLKALHGHCDCVLGIYSVPPLMCNTLTLFGIISPLATSTDRNSELIQLAHISWTHRPANSAFPERGLQILELQETLGLNQLDSFILRWGDEAL